LVSQAWKDLPFQQKQKYYDIACEDRNRFEREKANYKGPWKVRASDILKHDMKRAPKHPVSAFLLYMNTVRSQLRRENPSVIGDDLTRLIARKWKAMSTHEKKEYLEEAARRQQRFKVETKEWQRQREEETELNFDMAELQQLLEDLEPTPLLDGLGTPLDQSQRNPPRLGDALFATETSGPPQLYDWSAQFPLSEYATLQDDISNEPFHVQLPPESSLSRSFILERTQSVPTMYEHQASLYCDSIFLNRASSDSLLSTSVTRGRNERFYTAVSNIPRLDQSSNNFHPAAMNEPVMMEMGTVSESRFTTTYCIDQQVSARAHSYEIPHMNDTSPINENFSW
jgi:hypothetical protein